MAELERELRAIAVDWPPQPDLTLAVRGRIAERPRAQRRRALALALALLAVAVAAAFAVPSARTAILRWLGLDHVRVVHVAELPPTHRLDAASLGSRTNAVQATRLAGFELVTPSEQPDSVWVADLRGGRRVTLVYGSVVRPRLLLTEFRGVGVTKFVEKLVTGGTKVERVRVDGNPGLWLSGAPHAVYFASPDDPQQIWIDDALLAGNTLVWERPDGLTIRLEGDLSKGDALSLARSLR
jgi:hypothetical protein